MKNTLTNNTTLTYTLIAARQHIARGVKDAGDCDHETGICHCADKQLVATIDAILYDAFGDQLPWQFYHAEPTHRVRVPTKEAFTEATNWAFAALRIVKTRADDVMTDVYSTAEENAERECIS